MRVNDWMRTVKCAALKMPEHEKELCLLDTVVGDGDHGITISRGYTKAATGIEIVPNMEIGDFCTQYAAAISDAMGGAIGPIYGTIWKALAREFRGKSELSSLDFGSALRSACVQVQRVGNVKPGDKTVLDAMLPAAASLVENGDLPRSDATLKAAQAASEGCEATRNMIARKGRARYLPEKSVGHMDAGARSFALWLNELAGCMASKEG